MFRSVKKICKFCQLQFKPFVLLNLLRNDFLTGAVIPECNFAMSMASMQDVAA